MSHVNIEHGTFEDIWDSWSEAQAIVAGILNVDKTSVRQQSV